MNIKLGDLCKIQAGGTPSRSKQEYWNKGEIPWVKIGDIESKYLNKTSEFITDEGLKNSSAKKIEKGSILYTIFATLGEVCINNIDVTTNQAIAGITLKDDKVYIDYLYYFLKSLKNYVNAIGRGVAQNNINLTLLRGFDVPVPDKNRQLIIAQSLSNIEKMINNKKQQLSEYDQLIKSRFVEMFGDPILNQKGWKTEKLQNVCQVNKYKGEVENTNGKVWLLNLDMVESNTGKIINYVYEDENNIASSTIKFDTNCVLYSKLRPYLNKVVVPLKSGYATSEMISMKTDNVSKYFLSNLLMMNSFVDFANGTSYGAKMPRASVDMIKNFDLMLPPKTLQDDFGLFVEQVDKLKFEVQKSLNETKVLFDSLMQKYFG